MYKIVVVDDQSLIRKGIIKMIDWNGLGAELVGEANNGVSAMEVIQGTNPDIVITDMRMPGSDGISLLKNLNETYPNIKTIVISGYDDFQYAMQALKSGSVDYILKPVNPAELNASIRKAFNLMEKENKSIAPLDKGKLLTDYLYKLMHGIEHDKSLYKEVFEGVDLVNNVFCAVVIRTNADKKAVWNLKNTLKSTDKYINVYLIPDKKDSIFIFCCKANQDKSMVEGLILNSVKNISFDEDSKTIISIGSVCEGIERIKDTFDAAHEVMPYSLLEDKSCILKYSELIKRKHYNIPIEEYENELIISTTSGNSDQVYNILDKIMSSVLVKDDISIDSIKMLISNLCHILLKVDTGLTDEIQNFLKRLNTPEYLLSFDTIENIKQALFNLFLFTTKKHLNEKGGKEALIMNVKEFINKNYSNSIGLEEISKLFHVNASYLSSMFKKETGENLNEYITKIRINNAIRIMNTCEVKAPELAQMVGYSDYIYFHKVFKKVTGMTPKEFQQSK